MKSITTYLNSLGRPTRAAILALAVIFVSAGIAQAATVISTSITTGGFITADTALPGDGHSYQTIAGDAEANVAFGGVDFTHPKFGAGVMGNIHGDTLTGQYAYLGGVIGDYSLTGSPSSASEYPKGGLLGLVGSDGATTGADGAVVAVLDGDGGVVTADSAFGVMNLNSTPGSHFNYGLDLYHAAIGAYPAVSYGTADVRVSSGAVINSGDDSGLVENTTACPAKGSLFLGTSGKLWVCNSGTKWSKAVLTTP
ncbi:hypothetical protein HY091_03110 [Candidatus Kaiserbacteria bacterium]|nr:hypothetical protein [Candidatus Kaiserbacteria bacterium]